MGNDVKGGLSKHDCKPTKNIKIVLNRNNSSTASDKTDAEYSNRTYRNGWMDVDIARELSDSYYCKSLLEKHNKMNRNTYGHAYNIRLVDIVGVL